MFAQDHKSQELFLTVMHSLRNSLVERTDLDLENIDSPMRVITMIFVRRNKTLGVDM